MTVSNFHQLLMFLCVDTNHDGADGIAIRWRYRIVDRLAQGKSQHFNSQFVDERAACLQALVGSDGNECGDEP